MNDIHRHLKWQNLACKDSGSRFGCNWNLSAQTVIYLHSAFCAAAVVTTTIDPIIVVHFDIQGRILILLPGYFWTGIFQIILFIHSECKKVGRASWLQFRVFILYWLTTKATGPCLSCYLPIMTRWDRFKSFPRILSRK